jgi:hypothetical protein
MRAPGPGLGITGSGVGSVAGTVLGAGAGAGSGDGGAARGFSRQVVARTARVSETASGATIEARKP